MAKAEMTIEVSGVKEVCEALEKAEAMRRILSTLFATEVSDVRACRQCGKPVLHMEHLSLDEAKALETEARALLNIPANYPDEV